MFLLAYAVLHLNGLNPVSCTGYFCNARQQSSTAGYFWWPLSVQKSCWSEIDVKIENWSWSIDWNWSIRPNRSCVYWCNKLATWCAISYSNKLCVLLFLWCTLYAVEEGRKNETNMMVILSSMLPVVDFPLTGSCTVISLSSFNLFTSLPNGKERINQAENAFMIDKAGQGQRSTLQQKWQEAVERTQTSCYKLIRDVCGRTVSWLFSHL